MNYNDMEPEPEFVPWSYSDDSSEGEGDNDKAVAIANMPNTGAVVADSSSEATNTTPKHPTRRRCQLSIKSPYEKNENLEDREDLFTRLDSFLDGSDEDGCILDGSKRRLMRDYYGKRSCVGRTFSRYA